MSAVVSVRFYSEMVDLHGSCLSCTVLTFVSAQAEPPPVPRRSHQCKKSTMSCCFAIKQIDICWYLEFPSCLAFLQLSAARRWSLATALITRTRSTVVRATGASSGRKGTASRAGRAPDCPWTEPLKTASSPSKPLILLIIVTRRSNKFEFCRLNFLKG